MTTENEPLDIIEIAPLNIPEKIKNFSSILSDIETLDEKKAKLWREIYENAITDRQNSYVMFMKLAKIAADKSTEHAVHGRTIATYIERMSRANDQLIKLAELIAKAQRGDEAIDADSLFQKIQGG